MSFIKTFGISLAAFIGLNVVFFLIGHLLAGDLGLYFQSIAASPENILDMILGPIPGLWFPSSLISFVGFWILGMPLEAAEIILFIGIIVAPLVAAILSGRFGETKIEAFGGWFTTVMISALVVMIWGLVDAIIASASFSAIVNLILFTVGIGLTYGFGYGCISLLVSRKI